MKILVTGGAGYIGSVTVQLLIEKGHDVSILDDFSTGHTQAVNPQARLFQGSLLDTDFLETVFRNPFDAVVHFAGFSLVGESMTNPLKYYRNNVGGSTNLLQEIEKTGIQRFVFSSTAAVYGQPDLIPITEDALLSPVNPYGRSKLAVEWLLRDLTVRNDFTAVALRYFNACGASGQLGEDHSPETHLIPSVLKSLLAENQDFRIFGDDYKTPDGTCVRDYIHVRDLASAHLKALEWAGDPGFMAVNLGTSQGASVLEILKAVEKVTGKSLNRDISPRRSGDPDILVASADLAYTLFDWKPQFSTIEQIVSDAWCWHQEHPEGYC